MSTVVEIRELKRHYTMGTALVRALDGVSLDLQRGDFIGLLGTSGSGKSTLLNLIAGLDRPTSGTIRVFEKDLSRMSSEELSEHRRRNVGMVFQAFNLISTMTALENVALAMIFAAVPRAEREKRARGLLQSVGLGDRVNHRPSELSGGEQQRVSIARALANEPEILLADEPTGNLDSRTAREVLDLLAALNTEHGKTLVLVTHDQALAAEYVRRRLTLRDGTVAGEANA